MDKKLLLLKRKELRRLKKEIEKLKRSRDPCKKEKINELRKRMVRILREMLEMFPPFDRSTIKENNGFKEVKK